MGLLLANTFGGSLSKLYSDDVFGVQLRIGNGTSQSITTGFQPDLIWTKSRSATTGHRLVDSARGAGNSLASNSTLAQQSEATGITAFNSSGYSVGADSDYNTSAATYVDFVFRKSPKFFDVVTYTGNGIAGRQIPHSLGVAPGMIVTKATTSTADNMEWSVWHRGAGSDKYGWLNTTAAFSDDPSNNVFGEALDHTSSVIKLGNNAYWNNSNGVQYVAYLWAHDDSEDGIIQCGSFTTDGSGNATVNLGWEPQFVKLKVSSTTGNWIIVDSMRGMPVGSNDQHLYPNLSNAETAGATLSPTAVGFDATGLTASQTYIYLAIRRPNKPPSSGTEVFSLALGAASSPGFTFSGVVADTVIYQSRVGNSGRFESRLTGATGLNTGSTNAEYADANVNWDNSTFTHYLASRSDHVGYALKRAPGFFDVVCYTGNGVNRTVNHSLGVAPELMIGKDRTQPFAWHVYHSALGNTQAMYLNAADIPVTGAYLWNNTSPTNSVFSLGTGGINVNGDNFVAYLFASLPGISSCFSYTGNGTSQNINCGFTTGSRFILLKRTDAAGDWYVWDSARGIVSANDPHLSLNTTAAEVTTDDSVDPIPEGFTVNQNTATNVNVLDATYIGLAIA